MVWWSRIRPVPTPSSACERRNALGAAWPVPFRSRNGHSGAPPPRVPTPDAALLSVRRRRCVASLVPRVPPSLTPPHENRALAGRPAGRPLCLFAYLFLLRFVNYKLEFY